MAFDEERYSESFIKPLRGKSALPDDLAERYAIPWLGANPSVQSLQAHLATVRAFWNKGSSRLGPAGQVCQMCRAADELLKKSGVELDGTSYQLDDPKFWVKQAVEGRKATEAVVEQLASNLKTNFGPIGAVTREIAEQLQRTHFLNPVAVDSAISQAGLAVVETIDIPESPPIPQFKRLSDDMSKVPVKSVPELIHPTVGEFTLVDRFASASDAGYRMDLPAIEARAKALNRKAGTDSDLAAESALRILKSELGRGIDPREIAIFHLAWAVQESAAIAGLLAFDDLRSRGLVQRDAAIIVLSLLAQGGPRRGGLARVIQLLEIGQLNEARQALAGIGAPERDEATRLVSEAETKLAVLLESYKKAIKANDEAGAAKALKEAVGISEQDVSPLFDTLPPSPPDEFRTAPDGSNIRMFWRAGAVHSPDDSFVVTRREDRDPAAPSDGTIVHRGPQSECSDDAPIARHVYYSAFALRPNGITSRPVTTQVTLLPPVFDVDADVGPNELTVSWSVQSEAVGVEVRSSIGTQPERAVSCGITSCHLSGLVEGETCNFRLRALYRGSDGEQVASEWAKFTATPRGLAKAVTTLTARLVNARSERRLELEWTDDHRSDVRLRRSSEPPIWTSGTLIDLPEMLSFGVELRGLRTTRSRRTSIEVVIPPGVHHIVPFSIGGNGVVVGTAKTVATIDPVTDLAVDSFKGIGRVSWIWPPGVTLAEVSWTDQGERQIRTIGISEYHAHGVELPLGEGPRKVEVRTVANVKDHHFRSPPASVEMPPVAAASLDYDITPMSPIPLIGRRKRLVIFRSENGCPFTRVRVIASSGRIMPSTPTEGSILLETDVSLEAGGHVEYEVTIPKETRRPFWLRCFSMSSEVALAEPATSSLKVD